MTEDKTEELNNVVISISFEHQIAITWKVRFIVRRVRCYSGVTIVYRAADEYGALQYAFVYSFRQGWIYPLLALLSMLYPDMQRSFPDTDSGCSRSASKQQTRFHPKRWKSVLMIALWVL